MLTAIGRFVILSIASSMTVGYLWKNMEDCRLGRALILIACMSYQHEHADDFMSSRDYACEARAGGAEGLLSHWRNMMRDEQ